jgi:KaiC/GvpD/RAD55 family RecA-like ATPase
LVKIETGIPSFDNISGGGLPIPSAMALIGNAGSLKEIFIRQIVWNFLQKESKVLYFSINQSAEDLRSEMNRFNWDMTKYEKDGMLRIVDIFTIAAEKLGRSPESGSEPASMKALYDLKLIANEGRKFLPLISLRNKSRLVVLDSISPLFSTNAEDTLKMVHNLKLATRLTNSIGIGLMHTKIHDSKTEETFKSLADAIIEVSEVQNGTSTISLFKYNEEYRKGSFPFEAMKEGVRVIPIVMI